MLPLARGSEPGHAGGRVTPTGPAKQEGKPLSLRVGQVDRLKQAVGVVRRPDPGLTAAAVG